jgi:hypothetical protein
VKTATNFKTTPFRGTLLEVLEQGKVEADGATEHFPKAHEWLRSQLLEKGNILPVRKFGNYTLRGSLHPFGVNGSSFMPCDNETVAHLYKCWARSEPTETTIGLALTDCKLPASWRCEASPKPTMRFKGVKTPFRDRGLKLAHINDAGRVSTTFPFEEQIGIRFLRSLSPLNVFLFPSRRCCEYRILSKNHDWNPVTSDWAEDGELKGIALAWSSWNGWATPELER